MDQPFATDFGLSKRDNSHLYEVFSTCLLSDIPILIMNLRLKIDHNSYSQQVHDDMQTNFSCVGDWNVNWCEWAAVMWINSGQSEHHG